MDDSDRQQCCGLFCSAVLWTVLFCSAVDCSVLQCCGLFCSAVLCSAVDCSVLLCCGLFCSTVLWTVLQCCGLFCSAVLWLWATLCLMSDNTPSLPLTAAAVILSVLFVLFHCCVPSRDWLICCMEWNRFLNVQCFDLYESSYWLCLYWFS